MPALCGKVTDTKSKSSRTSEKTKVSRTSVAWPETITATSTFIWPSLQLLLRSHKLLHIRIGQVVECTAEPFVKLKPGSNSVAVSPESILIDVVKFSETDTVVSGSAGSNATELLYSTPTGSVYMICSNEV